jgi:fructose-bisphosphate aldolase, class II
MKRLLHEWLAGCFGAESEGRSRHWPFQRGDWVLLKAVSAAGQELKVPVVVGASEGEREFIGVREIAALVRRLREECDCPIFLNADHTHSLAKAVEAIRAGFDAIVFDLSALPFERNMRQTKDILAPAVGNMHGMLKSTVQGQTRKRLDIQRIAQIKSAARVPLTLHGGSGTDDEDLRKAIAAGINIIHINTELRVAWRRGLEEGLAKQPHEVVPYKILPFAVESVKNVVRSRLALFNGDK